MRQVVEADAILLIRHRIVNLTKQEHIPPRLGLPLPKG